MLDCSLLMLQISYFVTYFNMCIHFVKKNLRLDNGKMGCNYKYYFLEANFLEKERIDV